MGIGYQDIFICDVLLKKMREKNCQPPEALNSFVDFIEVIQLTFELL